MPDPQEIRRDPNTGQRAQWNGSTWNMLPVAPGGAAPSQFPSSPSTRTDADDLETFKNLLTGAGSLASMAVPEAALPLRMGMAALGGATGRSIGHGMVATTHADQPSFGEDALTGAEAGASGEALPPALGALLRGGGKVAQFIGSKLPANDYIRTILGGILSGGSLESHGATAAAGYLSKPVLEQGGALAERAGNKIGTKSTSQRVRQLLDSFSREPEPGPPTHTDINAAARDKVAQKKAAQSTFQNAGYQTPEGGPDMSVPFNIHEHVPADKSWPGMGPDATRAASPSPDSVMFTPPPSAPAYDGPIGKLTGRKAPTVNSALEDALNGLREQPATAREGAPAVKSTPQVDPPQPTTPDAPAAAADNMPSFTDWAAQMDEIINGATEADMPKRPTGFLSSSRPTKADRAGLDMLRRISGATEGIKQ